MRAHISKIRCRQGASSSIPETRFGDKWNPSTADGVGASSLIPETGIHQLADGMARMLEEAGAWVAALLQAE
jgi:hypothetical protein